MNTCENVQAAISRYIDGDLPASGEPEIFAHAASCPDCRLFLRSSMAIRAGLRMDLSHVVPARLDRRVLGLSEHHRHAAARAALRGWWSARLPLPLPAVAGAVAIILFLSALLLRSITVTPARTAQAEYILTLETVEVRGEAAQPRREGVQF